MRSLTDLRPKPRGGGGAGNKGILVGVTSGDFPGPRNASSQADFVPVGALAAGLHDSRRIVGISHPRIRSVQAKDCRCQREERIDIPLDA